MDDQGERSYIGGGRYAVDRKVGEGGGGAVYLAYDQTLRRWVAIKRVRFDTATEYGESAMNEATQLASLQHPNIVTVYDFLEEGGDVFVVMEYVAGQNLEDVGEAMSEQFFVDFAGQCLSGLAAAHAMGIVHRDIKPSNIMLAALQSGGFQVKVLDFGLAKQMAMAQTQTVDQSGALTGSIYTMSPEQLQKDKIDHRTDIYSMGCVFYQALTRRTPFQGETVAEVVAAHLQHQHEPLVALRPDLSKPIADWVERLFAFDVDERPASAAEAAVELRELVQRRAQAASRKPVANAADHMPKPEKKFRLPRPKPKKRESESGDSDAETEKEPFYKNQNFIILALAVVFCLTLLGIVLIKESGDGGGGAKKKPEAAASPTPEKSTFAFNDRKDISNRAGKQATVTGTVLDVFEEQGSSKILVRFEGADERDVMLAFDLKKGDFSKWKLGKFKGQKISATGVVEIADRRLFLDMASMDDLRPAGGQP
jgi:serine/threonine protein kinase